MFGRRVYTDLRGHGTINYCQCTMCILPGAVARSDASPPSMQTVAGSILTSGNILSWRLVMKSFLRPFSFFC